MMMFTPQQEAAQMFVAEQAAEVRVLDDLAGHNVSSGLTFDSSDEGLKSLLDRSLEQYKLGEFELAKKAAQNLINEAGRQSDKQMLVKAEYQLIKANARLGELNTAMLDRIFIHKKQLDDQSHLGELYFLSAELWADKGNNDKAKEYLGKAKRHIPEFSAWYDDVLFLETRIRKSWKSNLKKHKKILIKYASGGKGDYVLSKAEKQSLFEEYKKYSYKGQWDIFSNFSKYQLGSIKEIRNIALILEEKNKIDAAVNLYEWVVDHTGDSDLLNKYQRTWAWNRLSLLKDASLKALGKKVWELGFSPLSVSTNSDNQRNFKVINLPGKFGKDSYWFEIGPEEWDSKMSEVKYDIFKSGGSFMTIGQPISRFWPVELDFKMGEAFVPKKAGVPLYQSYTETLSTKVRVKADGFYFEVGNIFGGNTDSWSINYWSYPGGPEIKSVGDLDMDKIDQKYLDFIDQIDNQFLNTSHAYHYRSIDTFHYTDDESVSKRELGFGIYNKGVNDYLDYLGFSVKRYAYKGYFGIYDDPQLDDQKYNENGDIQVKFGGENYSLWINGQFDFIDSKKCDLGVLFETTLKEWETKPEEYKGIGDYYDANRLKGRVMLDLQYKLKLGSKSDLLARYLLSAEMDGKNDVFFKSMLNFDFLIKGKQ